MANGKNTDTKAADQAPALTPTDPSTPKPPAEWGDGGDQATADAEALAQANKNVSTPGDIDPAVRAAENAANPDAAKTAKANGNKSAKSTGGVVEAFLRLKGVSEKDVLSYSDERRTVVTAQGGKYQQRDGVFFTLGGPVLEGTLATTVITPLQPQG